MTKIEFEWGYYLQAYRLHQGLTKTSNFETRKLLRRSIGVALENKRNLPRAYGLLSFTVQTAWLSDWIDQADANTTLSAAIEDLEAIEDAGVSLSKLLNDLKSLRHGKQQFDGIVRTAILAYATAAVVLDDSDFDNHWALATANLYARKFPEALAGYATALTMADSAEVPHVSKSSVSVDFADARFFAGNDELEVSDEAYIAAIEDAIRMTELAIAENPTDPKRHRWNWTLGWAYYELAGYSEPRKYYPRSLTALQQLRNPHDLIRKNLIATYTALHMAESAAQVAGEFMHNNPTYTLDVENRWPYRSETQLDRWKSHLRLGGLPD